MGVRHQGGARGWSAAGAVAGMCLCVVVCGSALSASTNDVRILNSGGGWTTGTTHRCVSSLGAAIAASMVEGGAHIVHAGMLNAFVHRPDLDVDADGRADEDDVDDDGDALRDGVELTGSAFSPATPTDPQRADSDHDGASDGDESSFGTDPLDPTAYLAFESIRGGPGGLIVRWRARAWRSYRLVGSSTVAGLAGSAVRTNLVTAGSGTGTWMVAEAAWTNSSPAAAEFYRVDGP